MMMTSMQSVLIRVNPFRMSARDIEFSETVYLKRRETLVYNPVITFSTGKVR